jgi:outer membrane protein OmpU
MKHTLLASTALIALAGAAAAEIKLTGTARIGILSTEGSAAGATVKADSVREISAGDRAFISAMDAVAGYSHHDAAGTAIAVVGTIATVSNVTDAELLEVNNLRAVIARETNNAATVSLRAHAVRDLASMDAVIARLNAATATASAATQSKTEAVNRVRVSFALSGATDNGLEFGASVRADHGGNSSTGSQYLSGAFGKISAGDLNGADEVTAGNLSGVGTSGMDGASHQEFTYASASHNLGYEVSMSGVTFAASTDTVRGADSTKTGSNSALGLKWTGDMGGASVTVGVGTASIGTVTQDTYSATVAMGGLSITAISSTNDNGPAVALGATAASAQGATGTAHVAASKAADNFDTDHSGLSITYAMDAMTVTGFTRTESTQGVADKDYSGIGFAYSLGNGATLKAGFVDANDTSLMDFGVNFSF